MSSATFHVGDVFEVMAGIPDGSVDLIVTSPPFLALRSYLPADHPDKHFEIGSEATPAAFLSTLLALSREWRRILAPHGSLCVELGDTYAGSGARGGDYLDEDETKRAGATERQTQMLATHVGRDADDKYDGQRLQDRRRASHNGNKNRDNAPGWPLDKSLCLLPTLYPASLAYGRNLLQPDDVCDPWRIRNLIVWHRPNPPVGALGDKVRPSTSYVTVACTSRTRWFDLDSERTEHKADPTRYSGNGYSKGNPEGIPGNESMPGNPAGAPPLDCWFDTADADVWTIPTAPYKGSHYATFPPALPRRLINLMCPRQVCTVCGEPRRRLTEASEDYAQHLGQSWADRDEARPKASTTERNSHSGQPKGTHIIAAQRETLGWSDCGHDAWRRGIVLDPFAGSGTTLQAASELGRDSIGIDLDPRNLELARMRCGMFLEEAV